MRRRGLFNASCAGEAYSISAHGTLAGIIDVMSADSAPAALPPSTRHQVTPRKRGVAAVHASATAAVALSFVSIMAWVTSGRIDSLWPTRHLLEARAWQFVGSIVPALDAADDGRPPGTITGKVTWRITDPATPTPAPLIVALTPTPPLRGSALAPTPVPAPPVESAAGQVPRAPHPRDVPVSGALVMVVDADGNAVEARTDAAGEYTLGGLYPGRYRVVAAAPGFAPVVVDRLPDASLIGQVASWVRPGIVVLSNAEATVPIRIDRPSPPPLGAFARDVEAPPPSRLQDEGDLVACGAHGEPPEIPAVPMAQRLPVALTGSLADAPIASLRRYVPLPDVRDGDPATASTGDLRSAANTEPTHTQERARAPRRAVVAVVPVGSEEDGCAAITLASRGIEVIVAGIAPDGRAERQVLATRTLLASMRRDGAESEAHGPVIVGAGFATAIVMRAVADEAADIPMDWAGVAVSGRASPGSIEASRLEHRRAMVASRIGGVVLIAPVIDLFAVRRGAPTIGLPGWLAEAVTALGPADREVGRYVRFSARFAVDVALPPVLVVRRGPPTAPFDGAVDAWAREAQRVGVGVHVMADDSASALIDRVAAMTTERAGAGNTP